MAGTGSAYVEVEHHLLARLAEHKSIKRRDIDRIRYLCGRLGDPQRSAPVIHVTGTNGKTTTSRMIDTLLVALGLRTGRLTSPHLVEVRERISLSGQIVSQEKFVRAYSRLAPFLELADARLDRPLSFFEATTALGFAVFAGRQSTRR